MPPADLERIRHAATAFRDGIEAVGPGSLDLGMGSFPRGSCGDATQLLGAYLTEQGLGRFRSMEGWKDGMSHAWLQQGELVVDITADQFSGIDERVIVAEPSLWHSTFSRIRDAREATISSVDAEAEARLRTAYTRILACIRP